MPQDRDDPRRSFAAGRAASQACRALSLACDLSRR
jgi:hypothetical protein